MTIWAAFVHILSNNESICQRSYLLSAGRTFVVVIVVSEHVRQQRRIVNISHSPRHRRGEMVKWYI